jgi:protein-S-isoprenylcysteine O-methyltransferase Ste14
MSGPVSLIADVSKRLLRWGLFVVVLVVFALGVAGRTDLVTLNAFIVACAGLMLAGMLIIDPGLVKERFRGGQTGEDPARLVWMRVLSLGLFVFALLDIGRLHWSDRVSAGLAFGALAPGLVLTGLFLARAAHEDRFLTRHLEGYPDYAARVRFRLVPGVW